MKKTFVGFLVTTVFLIACNNNSQDRESAKSRTQRNEKYFMYSDSGKTFCRTDTGIASTDYIFDLSLKIPVGWRFDTLIIKDTMLKAEYRLYCLQCSLPHMKKFNSAIKEDLLDNVKKDRENFDPDIIEINKDILVDPMYTYELGPFDFFMNEKLVSICCIIDCYGWGGNHHNYSWYTFNYNLLTDKVIRFDDVFDLKSKKDSAEFISLTLHQLKETYCSDWYDPYHSFDFSFVKKGICINPALSWACGMQRAFLIPDSLSRYMNPAW